MIFDANMSYGPAVTPSLKSCRDPEELLEAMDWAGIDRALVAASLVKTGAPVAMNPLVAEELRPYERLEPVWALLPPTTRELGTPDDLFKSMKENGVRGLVAFPSGHKYTLDRTSCGEILDRMAERKIPLILPLSESSHGLSGWALVGDVVREFPRLRVLALGSGPWGEDRLFRPLLDQYEGLHLELSRYELDGGVAELVRTYGSHRLVFGSGYPNTAIGGALMTVLHAEIDPNDRDAIMGGNLNRLLEEAEL